MVKTDQTPLFFESNLLIAFSVTMTAVMGVSSVTPAFPAIAEAMGVAAPQTGWLITVYYVPGVVLTPILGVLSDRFGRKPVLGPSLLLFGLAGSSCALAPSFGWLLGLRFVQGIGAAALAAVNLTLIGDLYSGDRRAEAMGYNATVLSVGTAAYPALGGLLATIAWNVPFALPLLGVLTGLLVLFGLDNPEVEADTTLTDYFQTFVDLLHRRRVYGVFVVSFALFLILFGPYFTYFPIFMDTRFGAPSSTIGFVMSSVSIASGLTASRAGIVDRGYSRRAILATGFGLYAVSFAWLPYVDSVWGLVGPSLVYGVGQGLNVPLMQTILADLAPMEHRGAFMSANGMINRFGQTIGPLVAGAAFGAFGLSGVFYATALLAVAMVPVIVLLLGD